MQPSIGGLIRFLKEELDEPSVEKQDVIELEEKILKALEFQICYVTPILFLERFLRIFGLDQK